MAKSWHPIIDYSKCIGCLTCYNFCPHKVYEVGPDGKPIVAHPENCVELCRGCQKICPAEAIAYFGEKK
jgi:NAD-dependent dihydropyrimidine dehydrogenase PreA subunit